MPDDKLICTLLALPYAAPEAVSACPARFMYKPTMSEVSHWSLATFRLDVGSQGYCYLSFLFLSGLAFVFFAARKCSR
jgi:hypothetical protein